MNAYEQKQADRKDRLEARADRVRREGEGRIERAKDMASIIPFGQPILVGHYSEGRDRNYRKRIRQNFDKGFQALNQADKIAARADAVGTGGISSDDPDAVTKLRAELDRLEARQQSMKAENAAWTKAGNKTGRQADGSWVDPPQPAFRLSNNSANIRRIKQRTATLEANADRETKAIERPDGIKVVENADANRLQIFFPSKPDADQRAKLKSAGFRWAPSEGAWQRQLNNSARWAAEYALPKIEA